MMRSQPVHVTAMLLSVLAAAVLGGCTRQGPAAKPAEEPAAAKPAPARSTPAVAAPAPALPADGAWTVTLEGALPTGPSGQNKALNVYLERQGGQWRRAFGEAPTWNRACHKVDPAGLKLDGGSLKGFLVVTLNPDAWVPREGKLVACTFEIDAQVSRDGAAGTFRGTCGVTPVSGPLSAAVAPLSAALAKSCSINLNLEDVLTFGQEWKRRVQLAWTVRDGKPQPGKVTADLTAGGGKGTPTTLDADTAGLVLSAETLTGEFSFRTSDPSQVYRVRLSGIVVGTHTGGSFEGKAGDAALKGGVFTGSIVPQPAGK